MTRLCIEWQSTRWTNTIDDALKRIIGLQRIEHDPALLQPFSYTELICNDKQIKSIYQSMMHLISNIFNISDLFTIGWYSQRVWPEIRTPLEFSRRTGNIQDPGIFQGTWKFPGPGKIQDPWKFPGAPGKFQVSWKFPGRYPISRWTSSARTCSR